jgi:mannose-6-phosphate isomerase-like protein (cupin superfamily)
MNSNYFNQYIPNVYEKYDLSSKNTHCTKIKKDMKDYGPEPFTVNIEEITLENKNFRRVIWTGDYMQLTLMSINPGEDIGLELHPETDQFIRIEEGQGIVKMGDSEDKLDYQEDVFEDYAFVIPAGKWHNIINTGTKTIKLYSIYAPPQHPKGTVHKTKEDAEEVD